MRAYVKAAFLMMLRWIIAICIFCSREMLIVLTELINRPSPLLNNAIMYFKNLKSMDSIVVQMPCFALSLLLWFKFHIINHKKNFQ